MTTYQRLETMSQGGRSIDRIVCRLGRGGYLGMEAEDALEFMGLPVKHAVNLPNKVGFVLRDTGGGMNLDASLKVDVMVAHGIPKSVAVRLRSFINACRKRFIVLTKYGFNE